MFIEPSVSRGRTPAGVLCSRLAPRTLRREAHSTPLGCVSLTPAAFYKHSTPDGVEFRLQGVITTFRHSRSFRHSPELSSLAAASSAICSLLVCFIRSSVLVSPLRAAKAAALAKQIP